MIRSLENMRRYLDFIMAGFTLTTACHGIGARTSATAESWLRHSREAERNGEGMLSVFYFSWPSDDADHPDYFHNLSDKARVRRAGMLASPLCRGEFAIVDGRVAIEYGGDFGDEIFLDDNGMPIVQPRGAKPSQTDKWKRRNIKKAIEARRARRRPLSPYSLGTPTKAVQAAWRAKKEAEAREAAGLDPLPAPTALADYVHEHGGRQMSPLEKDLREKLHAGPKNNKPDAPVQVFGRYAEHADPTERVSRNAGGEPSKATEFRPAPAPNYGRPKPLDSAGRGEGTKPPGGFDVSGRGQYR